MSRRKLSLVIEFVKDRDDNSTIVKSAIETLMINHKGTHVGCIAQLLYR